MGIDFLFFFEKPNSMKKYFSIMLIALIAFSCKQNKDAAASNPPKAVAENTSAESIKTKPSVSVAPSDEQSPEIKSADSTVRMADSTMAFIVSFYSTGAGIDRGEPDKLKSFIGDYSKKIEIEITYTETHWGREGETDYCFPLKGLSDAQITGFITGAKDALSSAKQVHFFEHQPCRKGR
jgi:hypothetical protein